MKEIFYFVPAFIIWCIIFGRIVDLIVKVILNWHSEKYGKKKAQERFNKMLEENDEM